MLGISFGKISACFEDAGMERQPFYTVQPRWAILEIFDINFSGSKNTKIFHHIKFKHQEGPFWSFLSWVKISLDGIVSKRKWSLLTNSSQISLSYY